jgi:hypothetical protein
MLIVHPRKTLAMIVLFVAAFLTHGAAQTFWGNYSPSGVTDDIWCVTYANGTFAAVTNQGNLLTSPDGLAWKSQTIDPGVWLVSIAYGNGVWVVVGDKGTILISSDLKSWINAASANTNKLNGVLYNGTIWVAVGESGTIITSPDAQNWVLQPAISGVTGFLHGIAYVGDSTLGLGNGIWICGQNGTIIQGLPASSGSNNYAFSLYPNNRGMILPGEQITTQNLEALIYPDLGLGGVSLVGGGQGILFSSGVSVGHPPGQTFESSPSTIPSVDFRGLTYGNGYFVAAGEQGTIMTSADGTTWTQRFSGNSPTTVSTATLLSTAYSSSLQRFVITGTGGTILVSNALPTVFANVSTRGYVSSTQTFIGGFVIEGTSPRTVLIRADGPALSQFSVPGTLPDPVLTVYDSKGNVVATNAGWNTNTTPSAISAAAASVGAFALPILSLDSVLLLTLPPGAYTAQVTSAKGNSGTVLFEAYTD